MEAYYPLLYHTMIQIDDPHARAGIRQCVEYVAIKSERDCPYA